MLTLNKLKSIYTKSPNFIKTLYSCVPYKYRNGKHYRQWMNILIKNENVGNNPLKTVQLGFDNFNFYKRKYNAAVPINWESIPLLEKWETQENIDEFKNSNISKFYVTTGGVSGTPATFYQSKNIWFKELAFVNTFFGKYGYSPKDLKLSLRGGDFNNLPSDVFWKRNPISNEIHFSPFHLNKSTIALYVNQINKLKPRFFHSYPSGLLRLVQLMKENNLKLNYSPQ